MKDCKHTPMPEGYIQRQEWAEKKMKTHIQSRCPECKLWAIWTPKRSEVMKTASLEITLDLNIVCPVCNHWNDVRENDHECDYHWSNLACKRLNGKHEIKETHTCYDCGVEFSVDHYEIM